MDEAATAPKSELDATLAHLDAALAEIDSVREAASKSGNYAFDQPWAVFIRKMRMLTPQAYGGRIQNWVRDFYGWTKVDPSLNRGDVQCGKKKYWEVKVTLITSSNPVANFVQIRPYQDIDGYELFVVDEQYAVTRFRISKKKMEAELAELGTNAHGTADSVADHTNREYAIRFPWDPDSALVKRWKKSYQVDSSITADSKLVQAADLPTE